jgi:hypothetical protein
MASLVILLDASLDASILYISLDTADLAATDNTKGSKVNRQMYLA